MTASLSSVKRDDSNIFIVFCFHFGYLDANREEKDGCGRKLALLLASMIYAKRVSLISNKHDAKPSWLSSTRPTERDLSNIKK